MKVVAVVSANGGVGKTSVVANLAVALAKCGSSVVAIDLDPQNALRRHFTGTLPEINGISRAALVADDWSGIRLHCVSGAVVLPYGMLEDNDRDAFDHILRREPNWLQTHLKQLQGEDGRIVLIDVPTGFSAHMIQALSAADLVLVVALPDASSYAALPAAQRWIRSAGAQRPTPLNCRFIVNQADGSKPLARDVMRVMRAQMEDCVLTVIHRDQAVSEALASEKSVVDYDPHCQASQEFMAGAQALQTWQCSDSGRP